MSKYTVVYGYIALPSTFTHPNLPLAQDLNNQALANLKESDEFPPIVRDMFHRTELPQLSTFYQIVHFGASIKNLDHTDLKEFIEKFEVFLKTLIWYEAKMHLEIEIDGEYTYTWSATGEALERSRLQNPVPVEVWKFEADESRGIPVFTDQTSDKEQS